MDIDNLVYQIRQKHANREGIVRAEGRLFKQIDAFQRRLTEMNQKDRAKYEKRHGLRKSVAAESEDGDQAANANQTTGEPVLILDSYRQRDLDPVKLMPLDEYLYRMEVANHQAQAFYLALEPLRAARRGFWYLDDAGKRRRVRGIDSELAALAKQLPVWEWVQDVRGLGAISLGQIVGDAGNLANYDNPAKLWKRMGLGIVNGEVQRKTTDPELAILMGYKPRRHATMFVIGDNLIRATNPIYKALYDERKTYEMQRDPLNMVKENGEATLWAHKRAHRYMEKRLLRDLWQAWQIVESDSA